jgi:uncharacterized protein
MFWFLSFGLAWAVTVPVALSAHGIADFGMPAGLARLTGFAPAVAALIMALISGKARTFFARVFRLRTGGFFYVAALVLPALFLAASVWLSPQLGLPAPVIEVTSGVAVFAAIWLVLAFGEEAGWRGYGLPQLMEGRDFWVAASILGFMWAIWHFPLHLSSPFIKSFDEGVYWLGLFSLQIFLANFLICWLMVRSNAVIIPTLFHAAFNVTATLHLTAAVDLVLTLAIALVVLALAIVDPEPVFRVKENARAE